VATTFTGLATRGPAAGVTTVFPDGWKEVWHIARPPPGEPALDDAAFLVSLVRHLSGTSVFLAGISNGGGFAEHAARHGQLPLAGLFLVVDWAAGNGISGDPVSERLASAPGDPPVTRLTWSAPGCPRVVLYRIEGGGHGWPGGPQCLPARFVGPIPRHLDATGILLELVRADF
jgi:poly(3-hydroxybutyrate) depolymerase